jgi:hypothetical protein
MLRSSANFFCSTSIRRPIASMFFFHSVSASRYHDSGSVPRVSVSGFAVGGLAVAVAVAVLEAEPVEQRARRRRVVQRLVGQRRVVAADCGGSSWLAGSAWPLKSDADQLVGVEAHRHGPPQRDLRGRPCRRPSGRRC